MHHGDGVQAIFYDDPRVLTVSLHETPLTLFPGTGFPTETGGPGAEGSAVNVALPPGTDDAGWLRAFHAVVPAVLRAFRPQVLFTQCGADTYRLDPLADLRLTVDGQRAALPGAADARRRAVRRALGRHRRRRVRAGRGGTAGLDPPARDRDRRAARPGDRPPRPAGGTLRRTGRAVPGPGQVPGIPAMTDGAAPRTSRGSRGEPDAVDRAILATRRAVFPLLGLDPYDPRD